MLNLYLVIRTRSFLHHAVDRHSLCECYYLYGSSICSEILTHLVPSPVPVFVVVDVVAVLPGVGVGEGGRGDVELEAEDGGLQSVLVLDRRIISQHVIGGLQGFRGL